MTSEQEQLPRLIGTGRDAGNAKAVVLYLTEPATDDQIRAIHELVKAGSAAVSQPAGVPPGMLLVDRGAMQMAINVLTRAGKAEVVQALEDACRDATSPPAAQQDGYKEMFEAAVRALAEIDQLLGVGDDACGDPQITVSALKDFISSRNDWIDAQYAAEPQYPTPPAAQQGSAEAVAYIDPRHLALIRNGSGFFSNTLRTPNNPGKGTVPLYLHPAPTDPAVLRDADLIEEMREATTARGLGAGYLTELIGRALNSLTAQAKGE
ncbi:hypothetical protein [Pseudoxanthomonas sp. JBR18]|uniref:hypothetical protein n=1 Tax=Pseudoxanthomonas sp. JBR18 TaxID=2969308 RepID=UPI002305DEEC|nr:hypothetical protein [Pseudoxanthomonas sp. JBR18]WCE04472.1 hypothetical protein PJ250_00215 [Pseudoxanthomonas sp. JBR18]